ncbi:MAG: MFS transporter [Beijerinckiaceae bacterium]
MTQRLLVILGVCAFASAASMRVLDPVMPLIASEFSKTIQEAALLSTWFTISYAIGQPILGPMGDSFGKARLISISLLAVAVFLVMASLAPSFGLFGATRALTGIAAGGIIPLGIAMIGDRAPVNQRQILLARFMLATLSGQIAGGLIAGGLSPYVGWRGVLLIVAMISLAAGVGSWIAIKPRPIANRPPLSPALAMQNYATILRNPRALPLYLLVAAEGALIFGLFPYVADILKKRDGSGSLEAGIVVGGFALGGLVFGFLAKYILRRLDIRTMARIGGVLIAASWLLFAIHHLPWWSAVPMFALMGFGFYFLHNNFQTQATTLSETSRGSAVALFACFLFAGSALGPPFVGFLLYAGGDTLMLAMMAALVIVLGFVSPLVLKPVQS